MASYTENLELIKPDSTDLLETSRQGWNTDMDILDSAVTALTAALGGMKLRGLTQDEYDALENYDGSTLYVTTDTGRLYLGALPLSGGGSGTSAVLVRQVVRGTYGTTAIIEEVN